jgi:hypothetical protein
MFITLSQVSKSTAMGTNGPPSHKSMAYQALPPPPESGPITDYIGSRHEIVISGKKRKGMLFMSAPVG